MPKSDYIAEVYFALFDNVFPVDEFTEAIGIQPTSVEKVGDVPKFVEKLPPGLNIPPAKTCTWKLSTDYQKSNRPDTQLEQIYKLLKDKVSIIQK